MMGKLQNATQKIEEDNKEWLALIAELATEDQQAEEAIYSSWATEVEGGKAYIFQIDEASSLLSALQLKMNRFSAINSTAVPAHNNTGGSGVSHNSARRSAKLRPLQLPLFNGDPLALKEFWALFSVAVDQEDYDNITKFSYLRQQLQGPARDALAGLDVSEENYDVAVQILKERFEKITPEIIGTLYSKLKLMPRCADNPSSLRKTYDTVEKIVRQLKNVGVEVNSNQLLVMDILAKFSEVTIREITMRKNIDVRSTVEDTEKALREYIEQSELLAGMVDDLKPFASQPKWFNSPQRANKPTRGFVTRDTYANGGENYGGPSREETSAFTTIEGTPAPQSECVFCGELHFHAECPSYRGQKAGRERLNELGTCERCLSHGHSKVECRTRKFKIRCFFCKQTGDHRSAMCPLLEQTKKTKVQEDVAYHQSDVKVKASKKPEKSKGNSNDVVATKTMNSLTLEESSLLSTAMATISNPKTGARRMVRLIFDNCSHRSYINEQTSNQLQLEERKTAPLKVAVFGHEKSVTLDTKLVDLSIHLRDNKKIIVTVNTTPIITSCSLTPTDLPDETKQLLHTMKSSLADNLENSKGAPELLIGADLFWEFITGSKLKAGNGIYLIPTSLGMVLGGCYKSEVKHNDESTMLCLTERHTLIPAREVALSTTCETRAVCQPDIEEFWSLESIGIKDDPRAKDDDVAMDNFNNTVEYTNGRYEVEWPWRDNCHELPINYSLAHGRLKALLRRFKDANSSLPTRYGTIFKDQVEKGIIEKVPDNEISSSNVTHYLAHHAVVKDGHLTTKVRIVFDGSAKCGKQKPCLNECLLRGPVILPDLCAILIRFRLQPIAIVSDVEQAFHQIGLKKSQRDAVRFLWLKDDAKLSTNQNIETYRFKRVPFGTISSPFLLGATLLHHLRRYNSALASKIASNMYVDNCIISLDTEAEAEDFYHKSKAIFQEAGMNLREYCSSSNYFHDIVPTKDQCSTRTVKVLGLKWNSKADSLHIQDNWQKHSDRRTKREILKAAASIFDPLGWFQPVTVRIKCFIRDLWDIKSDWDDEIPPEYAKRWESIRNDVVPMFQVSILRHIPYSQPGATLITFTDASVNAYAATVYLRVPENEKWRAFLIFSKSRLVPRTKWKKEVTIPRLELLGLTIGVRLSKFVRQSIMSSTVIPVHIFCDSTCVLNWIQSDKPLDRFTTNRVKEIREVDNATFWYVRSENNPADLATRGAAANELADSQTWWTGPSFLENQIEEWPRKENSLPITSDDLKLITEKTKEHNLYLQGALLAGERSAETHLWMPCNIDVKGFSSLQKLLRVTVLVLKFIKRTIWRRLPTTTQHAYPKNARMFADISEELAPHAKEISEALFMWIRSVQATMFSDVRAAITARKSHQLCHDLNLKIDEQDMGRQAVRTVISQCTVCKRYRGHNFALPKMPALPRERVAQAKPFEYSGLDFIGPINVKVLEETKKSWICLFTCLAVRAVHLEWLLDCKVQTFINSLSRFIARRGTPRKIVSDNAAQFHLTDRLFIRLWKEVRIDDHLLSYVATKGIQWAFTTELAPWQGGVYERLVGITKNTMRTQIGRKLLNFDQFVTLLAEVEAVVNSRPITFVYTDLNCGHPLRPADFLQDLPSGTPSIDPSVKPEGSDAAKNLARHWKDKQGKLEQYWKLWYSEYLLSLRERDKCIHRNSRSARARSPEVGEVVLVEDEDAPRGTWKVARITKLLGEDEIRAAEMVLPNGYSIRRPLNKLYSLEIPTKVECAQDNNEAGTDEAFDGFEKDDIEAATKLHRRFQTHSTKVADVDNQQAMSLLLAGLKVEEVQSVSKSL